MSDAEKPVPPRRVLEIKWLLSNGWKKGNRTAVLIFLLIVLMTSGLIYGVTKYFFGKPTAAGKSATDTENIIVRDTSIEASIDKSEILKNIDFSGLFDSNSPYPNEYSAIKLGATAIDTPHVYPDAELYDGGNAYVIRPENAILREIVFGFYHNNQVASELLQISSIHYYYKTEYTEGVRDAAIAAFGLEAAEIDSITGTISWKNIKGYSARLEKSGYFRIRSQAAVNHNFKFQD